MDDFLKTEMSKPGAVPLEERETEIIEVRGVGGGGWA